MDKHNKDTYEIPVDSAVIKNEIDELMGGSSDELSIDLEKYLKVLEILSKDKLSGDRQDAKKSKEIKDSIEIYGYLKKQFHAQTGREASNLLKDRLVDPKVVKFWIDEGMIDDPNLSFSAELGYPELIK
jgi:hypothetical protein